MSVATPAVKTKGISPKVYVPAAAQAVAGVVLLVLGLSTEGYSLIVAALGTFGIGFGAKPGAVEPV